MSRRSGQIIDRGQNKWLVRVFLGRNPAGKRRYYNRTIRGTKKDAQRYLTKVHRESDLGQFVEPSDRAVEEYLTDWLESTVKARVAEKTASDYAGLVERHIAPGIGEQRLSQLTPAGIQRLYNGLLDKGLSARTVRYVHSVLHSALDQAVAWGLLSRNPAKLVDLPRMQRREIRVLSTDELGEFLKAASSDRYSVLWHLLATTGIRPGEALALQWRDVDGERIRIQRNLVRHGDNRWTLKDPKTARGRRTVTVPATVVETLKQHRTEQLEERLRGGPDYEDHGLVFAASNGSPLDWKVVVARHFRPLAKDVGFPKLRPYDLRHTHATLLLQAGVNVKVVSERLGHASAALTLDVYSHVLPDMQQGAAERMEALLSS